jgi:ribulose-phosphate 3-epimerase
MSDFLISASILSADFRHLENEIRTVEDAGVDWLHIDVMDGQFVPNISMGPFIVDFCKQITSLPLDVHLMIVEPEKHIHSFASAGANSMTIHSENHPNVLRTAQEIKALGCQVGLALNPGTPAAMASSLLDFIDLVLVMTVNPGYSGQAFIPEMIQKITNIRELITEKNSSALIQVDGGISAANITQVVSAGANVVVSASSIFKHPDGIQSGVQALINGYENKKSRKFRDS